MKSKNSSPVCHMSLPVAKQVETNIAREENVSIFFLRTVQIALSKSIPIND
jgi:hypothetical protein